MLMSVADVICYLELCYCTRLAPSCCSVGQEQHTCPLVLLPYVGPVVPAAGIWVSECKHLALPAEIRSSASCLRSFVTQNSDFLCAAFSSSIRDAT